MKFYITLVVVVLGIFGKGLVQSFPTYSEDSDETIWPIPQQNGSVLWMTEEEAIADALQTETTFETRKSANVRFFLYTQKNPRKPIEIYINDTESLRNSTFDSTNPTRFMIHGWATQHTHEDLAAVRKALLLNGEKKQFNFISVDWSVYADTSIYITAKNSCSKAGKKVAELIDWLHNTTNLSFDTLAVYGHSLGAHVAGFTGKTVKQGRIHTIVGLDPAMPFFRIKYPEQRLSATDAKYVETIHTSGGRMGFYNPIGQTAFYPNGGKKQPGCGQDLTGSCAHGRSTAYFAEALSLGRRNRFIAVKCKDFESLKNGNCNQYSVRTRLGDPRNSRFPNGIYFLETNSQSLYGTNSIV